MQTHRVSITVSEEKSITLKQLPFAAGEQVDVIVTPAKSSTAMDDPYPLRGVPIQYDHPTEPVAENDWETQ